MLHFRYFICCKYLLLIVEKQKLEYKKESIHNIFFFIKETCSGYDTKIADGTTKLMINPALVALEMQLRNFIFTKKFFVGDWYVGYIKHSLWSEKYLEAVVYIVYGISEGMFCLILFFFVIKNSTNLKYIHYTHTLCAGAAHLHSR